MARPASELVLFTKILPHTEADELIETAGEVGLDGYDLCLRAGYPVNPDNVVTMLPAVCGRLRAAGLNLAMVSGEGSLVSPDDPTAQPILAAMDDADVRLLKLG